MLAMSFVMRPSIDVWLGHYKVLLWNGCAVQAGNLSARLVGTFGTRTDLQ